MNIARIAYLASATALATLAVPASAAPITRTFTGTLTFADGGPVTATTFGFGFTYDPMVGLTNRKVDYFTTSSTYAAFDPSSVYVSYTDQGFTIDGEGGNGLYYTKPDFFISVADNTTTPGSTPAAYRVAGYTTGDGSSPHLASLGTLVETMGLTPAVPEPATWAMMIVGFGLVGGTMRRRHRATVRFA